MAVGKNPTFGKVLLIVFTIAFALVALTMIYKAAQENTESRSKAANVETIVKSWSVAEGNMAQWKTNGTSAIVGSNWNVTIKQTLTRLMNQQFSPAAAMPTGNKYFVVHMRLGNQTAQAQGGGGITAPTPPKSDVSAIPLRNIRGTLYYWVRQPNGSRVRRSVNVAAKIPIGIAATLQVKFPEIGVVNIDGLSLDITEGLKPKEVMSVTRLKLIISSVASPTPTPTPSYITPTPGQASCGSLAGISYIKPCQSGYAYGASFVCSGGFSGAFDGTTCRTFDSLRQEAVNRCGAFDTACLGAPTGGPVSGTPSPYIPPTSSPISPTPTPTPSYQ